MIWNQLFIAPPFSIKIFTLNEKTEFTGKYTNRDGRRTGNTHGKEQQRTMDYNPLPPVLFLYFRVVGTF